MPAPALYLPHKLEYQCENGGGALWESSFKGLRKVHRLLTDSAWQLRPQRESEALRYAQSWNYSNRAFCSHSFRLWILAFTLSYWAEYVLFSCDLPHWQTWAALFFSDTPGSFLSGSVLASLKKDRFFLVSTEKSAEVWTEKCWSSLLVNYINYASFRYFVKCQNYTRRNSRSLGFSEPAKQTQLALFLSCPSTAGALGQVVSSKQCVLHVMLMFPQLGFEGGGRIHLQLRWVYILCQVIPGQVTV